MLCICTSQLNSMVLVAPLGCCSVVSTVIFVKLNATDSAGLEEVLRLPDS